MIFLSGSTSSSIVKISFKRYGRFTHLYYLTNFSKLKKQPLLFLRAPKHFKAGKQVVKLIRSQKSFTLLLTPHISSLTFLTLSNREKYNFFFKYFPFLTYYSLFISRFTFTYSLRIKFTVVFGFAYNWVGRHTNNKKFQKNLFLSFFLVTYRCVLQYRNYRIYNMRLPFLSFKNRQRFLT